VKSSDEANGAVVVPLMTPSGCVGVFAVELPRGAEQREPVRALTTSLAAQFADLLRAPDSDAVAALAGTSAPADTTSAASLSPFPVADSMFGQSGKLRFRTLTRVSAIAAGSGVRARQTTAVTISIV
jgi:hypothetical protein